MSIREPNKFGTASLAQVTSFEAKHHIKLPADYRQFMLDNNGGRPVKNIHPILQTDVNWLFGLNREPVWASLDWNIENYRDRLPPHWLPLACDSGGNLFLLQLDRAHHGTIVFWNHEGEAETDDNRSIQGMPIVAKHFSDFLARLTD